MRVLIVEDDAKIGAFIQKGFKQEGFAVDLVDNGEDGMHLAINEPYDALIVDIMLPGMDGLTLIEEIRSRRIRTPVLILSAKRSVDDRVRGIQRGGDDYLVKPFAFSELLVRVQALIRRSTGVVEDSGMTVGDLSLDLLKREAIRDGKTIELRPREFMLLEYLMRNADRTVSKTMILEHVWDFHFDPQTNVVDVAVCRLRSKVDKDFPVKMIHTVRGFGYVLKTPPGNRLEHQL
ncbi:MAG: response regulator transcription factor [Desulfobacteraceae bacterium]|nr:response regulator transcription factor [Desulfobacteraceae bacterium]